MVLGKISQLIVYERALKNHSDKGNRKSVEFFARLICEIAGARVEEKLNSLDEIFLKKIYEREDIKSGFKIRRDVDIYKKFLEKYCTDSPQLREYIEQANVNSWKNGEQSSYL